MTASSRFAMPERSPLPSLMKKLITGKAEAGSPKVISYIADYIRVMEKKRHLQSQDNRDVCSAEAILGTVFTKAWYRESTAGRIEADPYSGLPKSPSD